MSVGGYRKGSGRSKTGYYKGIYCGSTYELCWIIYSLDHNIQFERFPGKLERDGLIYYPDFLLADGKTIVETKGYELPGKVDAKTKLAESFGYTVNILRKDDLAYAFEYVEKQYGTKKFYTLYDRYKPQYTYICSNCSLQFSRDRKTTSTEIFCTRSCAGKYRSKRKQHEIDFENANYKRRLTKQQALDIYHNNNLSYSKLAKKYDMSKALISFIKIKRSYKWIHNAPVD